MLILCTKHTFMRKLGELDGLQHTTNEVDPDVTFDSWSKDDKVIMTRVIDVTDPDKMYTVYRIREEYAYD
jgi:hypothetical protein